MIYNNGSVFLRMWTLPSQSTHEGEVTGLHANPIMMLLLREALLERLETKGSSFGTESAANLLTMTQIHTRLTHASSLDDSATDRQERACLFFCRLEMH